MFAIYIQFIILHYLSLYLSNPKCMNIFLLVSGNLLSTYYMREIVLIYWGMLTRKIFKPLVTNGAIVVSANSNNHKNKYVLIKLN